MCQNFLKQHIFENKSWPKLALWLTFRSRPTSWETPFYRTHRNTLWSRGKTHRSSPSWCRFIRLGCSRFLNGEFHGACEILCSSENINASEIGASVVNLSLDLRKEQLGAHLFFIEGSLLFDEPLRWCQRCHGTKLRARYFPESRRLKRTSDDNSVYSLTVDAYFPWLFAETKELFVSQNIFSLITPCAKSRGDLMLTPDPIRVWPSSGCSPSTSWQPKPDWYRQIPRKTWNTAGTFSHIVM